MSKPQASGQKHKPKRLSIRRTRSPNIDAVRHDGSEGTETVLPPAARERLWHLFEQIERDFENVYIENLTCKYIIFDFVKYL